MAQSMLTMRLRTAPRPREVINAANISADASTIGFAIPTGVGGDPGCDGGGVCTIVPASYLPLVAQPATIDGYTQPGASVNTNVLSDGDNAVLKIVLRGSS